MPSTAIRQAGTGRDAPVEAIVGNVKEKLGGAFFRNHTSLGLLFHTLKWIR